MANLKICFVWVKKFRNFNNTGLNFSSTDKFEFSEENNSLRKRSISSLPIGFFGSTITEVTGLIGKNGSGKSNALELVCKVLKSGKSTISEQFLVIVELEGAYTCYHNLSFEPHAINFDINIFEYDGAINPLKIVYFSNVYDQRNSVFGKDVSDISNNKRYSRMSFFSSRYIKSDFEKQLEFINSNLFDELAIDIPDNILITNNLWRKRISSSRRHRLYGSFAKEFDKISEEFNQRLKGIKPKTRFFYILVYSEFLETLAHISSTRMNKREENDHYLNEFLAGTKLFRDTSTKIMIEELIKWMTYIWTQFNRFQKISKVDIKKEHENRLEMLNDIRDSLDEIVIEDISEGSGRIKSEVYKLNFKKNLNLRFFKHIALLEKSYFIDINWEGISSGHKAYLNLFSLIYSEVRRLRVDNLLLCIDEGDLYLHPKWQTEFFAKLLTVLPKMYAGNIQLILTSHSPFLLSDIPKQCLTILDKSSQGYTREGVDLPKETFAGNIYDLYQEPFFLGNQKKTIFSTLKIRQIIDSLGSSDENRTTDEIDKLIDLIGDDVIRFHLQKRRKND